MTVVETVKHNTHALPGSDQRGDTENVEKKWEHTPRTADMGQCDEQISEYAEHDQADTKTTGKDNTRTVAIADGPANEVGMSLTTERPFDSSGNIAPCRRVSGVGEGMEERRAFSTRQVELTGSTISDVDADDTVDLVTERLDGDCRPC